VRLDRHVVATLPVGRSRYQVLAVTGRFQPFHNDHLGLVRYALARAERVVIGITNPDPATRQAHPASEHRHLPSANPFSYTQRRELIEVALLADGGERNRFDIVPFPLEEPAQWPSILPFGTPQLVRVFSDWEREKARRFEAAGYPVCVLQGNVACRISASDIRAAMAKREQWQHWVPPGARELLASWELCSPGACE